MPRMVANAARVGIDLLPHLDRLVTDPTFATIVDLSVEEGYAIRQREADQTPSSYVKGKGKRRGR